MTNCPDAQRQLTAKKELQGWAQALKLTKSMVEEASEYDESISVPENTNVSVAQRQ